MSTEHGTRNTDIALYKYRFCWSRISCIEENEQIQSSELHLSLIRWKMEMIYHVSNVNVVTTNQHDLSLWWGKYSNAHKTATVQYKSALVHDQVSKWPSTDKMTTLCTVNWVFFTFWCFHLKSMELNLSLLTDSVRIRIFEPYLWPTNLPRYTHVSGECPTDRWSLVKYPARVTGPTTGNKLWEKIWKN